MPFCELGRFFVIEKFTFDIVAPKITKKLILVKNEGERREHVVLKLMCYVLFYDVRLKIEPELGLHFRPDLAIAGDHDVPEMWIDCGQISLDKADKLSRKLRNTRLIFVKETVSEMQRFKATVDKKTEHGGRIEYLAFDNAFIENMAAHLSRSNEWTLYDIEENVVGVTFGDNVFETHLHRIERTEK
ncbi:MAG: hypothetical protein A2Y02_01310 [Omnitrophica bacterium GWA2_52_12]|nr:MAG: hypothetical protein A2Y02_01310 [Omnitrophica bacterium GWA2_52_12]